MTQALRMATAIMLALCIWTHATASTTSHPPLRTIATLAKAPVTSEDIPKARQKALDAALRQSVETVLCDITPSETMVLEFDRVTKLISDEFRKYIKSHRVLAESPSNGEYQVLVQVDVGVRQLRKRLTQSGILVKKSTLPNMLLLLGEKGAESPDMVFDWAVPPGTPQPASPLTVHKRLTAKGFKTKSLTHAGVANSQDARNFFDMDDPRAPGHDEALMLGQAVGADVVVVGDVVVSPAGNTMGDLRSFSAEANAIAYRVSNGRELTRVKRFASTTNTDSATGNHEAMEAVTSRMAQDLSTEIASAWEKDRQKPQVIDMAVSGQNYLGKLVKLRQALNKMDGVTALRTVEMKPDGALLRVHYKGDAASLSKALILLSFNGFGLDISNVAEGQLDVKLVTEPAPGTKTRTPDVEMPEQTQKEQQPLAPS